MTKIYEITATYTDGSKSTQREKGYTSGDAICAFLVALGYSELDGLRNVEAKELSF